MDREAIKSFLDDEGLLRQIPAKHKKKLAVLAYLAEKFEKERVYTEKEVNDLLDSWTLFHDPATLRRELYDNRFLDRERDGSAYRLAEKIPEVDE